MRDEPDLVNDEPQNLVIDTEANVVLVLNSAGADSLPLSVWDDVSSVQLADDVADEQLANFQHYFLPIFPMIYFPPTMTSCMLRREKPLLWLVVMALTTKSVTLQFDMERLIWRIISQRVVTEHAATLDLLLGIICFTSWWGSQVSCALTRLLIWTTGPTISRKTSLSCRCSPK